jgi:hypothetical protein
MNFINRLITLCMIICLASGSAYSQEDNEKAESNQAAKEQLKTEETRVHQIHTYVDSDMIEVNVEAAVNNAMEIVRTTLQNLEIQIPPINIEPVKLDAIDINLDDMDIDIEPVDIDLDDMNFNFDADDFNENMNDESVEDGDDNSLHDRKDNKSKSELKDKAKGLKKLN